MEVMDITRLRRVNELANTLSKNRLVSNKMEAADLASTLAGRKSEQELKRSVVDKNQFLVHDEQKAEEHKQSPAINYCTKDEASNMFNKLSLQLSIENDKLKASISETSEALESFKAQSNNLQKELSSVKEDFASLKNEYAVLRDEYNTLWQQLNQTIEDTDEKTESMEELSQPIPETTAELPQEQILVESVKEYDEENTKYNEDYVQNTPEEQIITSPDENNVESITETQEYEPAVVDVSELEEIQPETETITLEDLQEGQNTYEGIMDNVQENLEDSQDELAANEQEEQQVQLQNCEEMPAEEEALQGYVEQQDFSEQQTNLQQQEQKKQAQEQNEEFIINNKEQTIQEVFNVFINEDLEVAEEQFEHSHDVQQKLFNNNSCPHEPKTAFHHKTGNITSEDVSVEKMFYYGR